MTDIEYIVQKGDNLSKIARKFKLKSWKSIYYYEKNREFREKRPDPNLIRPGDRLIIPIRDPRLIKIPGQLLRDASRVKIKILVSYSNGTIAQPIKKNDKEKYITLVSKEEPKRGLSFEDIIGKVENIRYQPNPQKYEFIEIDERFDWTSPFRVYIRASYEEYRPEKINQINSQRRKQMLDLLTKTDLPKYLYDIIGKTISTGLEYNAYISSDGVLLQVQKGEKDKIEIKPPSTTEKIIGYVHTHPTPSVLLAPPSAGDADDKKLSFKTFPVQLLVEGGNKRRVWGVFEPKHTTLLGRINDKKEFEELDPNDKRYDLVYRIVDIDQLKMEEYWREREYEKELMEKSMERRKILREKLMEELTGHRKK